MPGSMRGTFYDLRTIYLIRKTCMFACSVLDGPNVGNRERKQPSSSLHQWTEVRHQSVCLCRCQRLVHCFGQRRNARVECGVGEGVPVPRRMGLDIDVEFQVSLAES